MSQLEQKLNQPERDDVYSSQVDEIIFKALDIPEIQEVVKGASSKAEAITRLRALLPQILPEISHLPPPQISAQDLEFNARAAEKGLPRRKSILGPASNDFIIALRIIELLSEEPKK